MKQDLHWLSTIALRSRNTEWARAVVLLLLLARLSSGEREGPPHGAWSPPRGERAPSRRWRRDSLTGRRPRG